MKLKAELVNVPATREAIAALNSDLQRAILRAINAGILAIHKRVVESIQSGPAGGAEYLREAGDVYMSVYVQDGAEKTPVAFFRASGAQNLSKLHKASAPGEAPKTDTGNLASQVLFDIEIEKGGMRVIGTVTSHAVYSSFLEFGTAPFTVTLSNGRSMRNRGIKPRPFMRPAWEAEAELLRRKIPAYLRKVIMLHGKQGGA